MASSAARIVIVGAGPGGAMLAYLLASRGGDALHVTLIERQSDFEREFRGEVLMPSGIDVFRQAGLVDQFAAVPKRALRRACLYYQRRYVGELDLAEVLGRRDDAVFTAVSQPAMLEMLVHEALRFGNLKFERGVAVRDLTFDKQDAGAAGRRVIGVELAEHGRSRVIDASLVIGADGRASTMRRNANLEATRRPQSFDIVWCKAPAPETSGHRPQAMYDGASVYLGDRHFALVFPTYDGRLQIAWVIRKGAIGELRAQGVEHWVNEMAGHVTPELGQHLRAHLNEITQPFLLDVICDLMPAWTRPGLLLIGDAAHPMSPVGGQGINIALRDAVVAANHLLSAVRSGGGDARALDEAAINAQCERMPEVKRIQRAQQFPPRLLFGPRVITRSLLAVLPALVWTGIAQRTAGDILRRFAFGVSEVRLRH